MADLKSSVVAQDARACLCNMCGQMERDQDTFATDEEYMCGPSCTVDVIRINLSTSFLFAMHMPHAARQTCHGFLERIRYVRDNLNAFVVAISLMCARGYLDEASNPESLRAISCPVSPCLRQLRPVLLQAQHLLEEVSQSSPWW
jgi:hypothetical protein